MTLLEIAMSLMKKMFLMLIFLPSFALLTSCSEGETVRPFAEPETLAEKFGNGKTVSIDGSFSFDTFSIDTPIEPSNIPVIGNVVDDLLIAIANTYVQSSLDWQKVELPPIDFTIPEFDYALISELAIDKILLTVQTKDGEMPRNSRLKNLSFVKKMDIYLTDKKPSDDQPFNPNEAILLTSFDNKRNALTCRNMCLGLTVPKNKTPFNLKPLLKSGAKFYVIPKVLIKSVPEVQFEIRGDIFFKLELDLPS